MLTYKDIDGVIRIEGCDEGNVEESIRRCVDRLYAYERLGLTPEEVRKAIRELKELRKASSPELTGIDYEAVVGLFNGICSALPAVKGLTDARRRAIVTAEARLKKAGLSWEQFFRKVADSTFLSGKWKGCSFDWILKQSNMQKIVEGNFDDRSGSALARGSFSTDEFFEASIRRSYGEL